MASGKEIRTQIESIQKTQKITSAMELVAASKMRKAQDRMTATRPYAKKALQICSHVANCTPEYKHPYLQKREVKRVGYIVVTSDRGLCGGLNNILLKKTLLHMQGNQNKEIEADLCLVGRKAGNFFRRAGGNVLALTEDLGDAPSVLDLVGVVKVMLDLYDDGKIDELYIAHNDFVNTMTQNAIVQKLLPLEEAADESKDYHWDYIYEPDAKQLLDSLLKRYVESQVYQAVVENIACEQASRMVAMKSATDNAGDLMDELRLVYNKARQAVITREIAEIVSGAEAV